MVVEAVEWEVAEAVAVDEMNETSTKATEEAKEEAMAKEEAAAVAEAAEVKPKEEEEPQDRFLELSPTDTILQRSTGPSHLRRICGNYLKFDLLEISQEA
jgi:hypothetical protein